MTRHHAGRRAGSVFGLLAACAGIAGAQITVTRPDPEVSVNIRNEQVSKDRAMTITATPGSYVTVIRVNAAGEVDVLYPAAPVVERAMIPSSRKVLIPRTATVSNPRGAGSIFAFVSNTPYVFSKVADRNGWNSLHLANYRDPTDETIAESFGNEIAAPSSRVIMSKATTQPTMIVSRDHNPMLPRLASFRNKPCPSLSLAVNNSSATSGCLGTVVPPSLGRPVPMQSQTAPTTSH